MPDEADETRRSNGVGGGDGKLPVVVLIHGGFWRAVYTKVLMNGLARSVASRGWAAWNLEYRRVGLLGGGGGWPDTFHDIASGIDHIATVEGLDVSRVVACGHSAGGQLALWACAREKLELASSDRGFSSEVRLRGAVSLAGVVDLSESDKIGLGNDAVSNFLGGHRDEVADRYAMASPRALLPLDVPQVLIHGSDDDAVPPSMSEEYCKAASQLGDRAEYVPIQGVGHRDLINPKANAWEIALGHLEVLLS
ncbi:MAG: alpha/beta hydrolase [Acidimicrobiales bacterium]